MSSKFVIRKQHAASRWEPIGKYKITRSGDCINCGKCVRLCIFEVHKRSEEDYRKMADPGDYKCKNCFMCIQGCTRGALSMSLNPAYLELGDGLYTPEIITSLMKQAETGEIPVSGTGYGGRFSAAGFDALWTDMSEIVRPTRDGIHGREYISTTVDLGRKPLDVKGLRFDPYGNPLTNIPPTVEIKLPIIFDRLPFLADHPNILLAQAKAATVLGTFTIVEQKNFSPELEPYSNHLIMSFSPEEFSWKELVEMAKRHSLLEVAYSPDITGLVSGLKKINPDLLFIVRIENHWEIEKTVTELGQSQVAMFHLHVEGTTDTQVLPEIIHRVHRLLVAQKLRDSVTVIASGQIAAAEHVPKAILLGADAVAVDRPTLIALECTLCKKCLQGQACPRLLEEVEPDWGAQRMVNLMASWHNQLLEVLGAMGLREVSRLRGEMGRAMFKEALEEETFKKIFVKYPEAVKDTVTVPPLLNNINDISTPTDGGRNFRFLAPLEMTNNRNCDQTRIGAPSRFNRPLARFKVLRGPSCIACGTCEKVCPQGVHRRPLGFNRMAEPEHHKCLGFSCSASLESCVALCPRKALSVTINPQHQALGDYRWTPDMILAVYQMAETGEEPHLCGDYHCGNSGGGFDRIRFRNIHFDSIWPTTERTAVNYAPIAEIETSIDLNRRGEGPEIRIPIPIYGGGMSFGSVSLNTMLARAMAAKELDTFTCTGEGGYPEELIPYADHIITQVATGLFGVREETIQRARIIEFKYAQGAKPGLGGHLLADKVTPAVARMRQSVPWRSLFSPFPFHSVYSVEDHKKHIDWIKTINPEALISVKVSTPSDVDMVAVGSYYAGANIIHLDGGYGGTGAAPDIAKKNIAMPIEYAVPRTHDFLVKEGIRQEMVLIASGGIRTAHDIAKIIALGADGVVLGTAELVALECVRCGNCESGRGCPRGIATTDPELSTQIDPQWGAQRLVNLYQAYRKQLVSLLHSLGLKSIKELRGRRDLLYHLDFTGNRCLELKL